MIKEEYVSFEVAKLLKEKGFDIPVNYEYHYPVNYEYHYKIMIPQFHRKKHNFNGIEYSNCSSEWYSAPTHQMAMAWLREVHNIIIEPESVWNGKEWEYLLFVVTPQNADSPYYEHNPYKSYEECVEAALKYILENLI